MLRITEKLTEEKTLELVLEGRLVGPWVELLRANCEQGTAPHLTLDLAELSYADEAGLALLRQLQSRHCALTHCSPFVQAQLKQPAGNEPITIEVA